MKEKKKDHDNYRQVNIFADEWREKDTNLYRISDGEKLKLKGKDLMPTLWSEVCSSFVSIVELGGNLSSYVFLLRDFS